MKLEDWMATPRFAHLSLMADDGDTGSGDTGADGGGTPPDPAVAPEGGGSDKPWHADLSLDADAVAFIDRVGVKDLNAAFKHAAETEKFVGVPPEQLLRLPEKSFAQDPEAYKDIAGKMFGMPDEASGMELKGIEGVFNLEGDMLATLQKGFHEAGVPPHFAQGAIEVYGAMLAAQEETQKTSEANADTEATAVLKQEWGAAFDDKVALAEAAELSQPQEFTDFLTKNGLNSNPHMVRMLAELGEAKSERGSLPGTNDGGGGTVRTPAQMDAALNEFDGKYGEAINKRGHSQHKWAVEERLRIISSGIPRAST